MEETNEVSLLPEEMICDDKQYMACIYQLSGYFHLKKILDFYHQQYLWKKPIGQNHNGEYYLLLNWISAALAPCWTLHVNEKRCPTRSKSSFGWIAIFFCKGLETVTELFWTRSDRAAYNIYEQPKIINSR